MVEPIPFHATTNPVITTAQYNKLLAQLETTASYIVRKNGAYYEALKGGTSSNALNVIYGGSGNNGATDGSVFEEVFNAAEVAAAGDHIHIKGGAYSATDECVITNANTIVTGEGKATKITQTTANKACFSVTTKANVIISNMWLYGTGAGTGSGVYATTTCTDLQLDHLICENWGYYGVHVINCSYIKLLNNQFISNIYNGVLLDTVNYGRILNNKINTNIRHGIALDDCNYNLISHNDIIGNDSADSNTYDGVNLSRSAGDCDHNRIVNNVINGNDRYEVNVVDVNCEDNTVAPNTFDSTGDHTGILNDVGTNTVSTLATSADLTTHAALDTGVHGAGASTLATLADIASNNGAPGSYTYLLQVNGADAEAYDDAGTLVYGGAGDAGAVDGADHDAVLQACIQAGARVVLPQEWDGSLVTIDENKVTLMSLTSAELAGNTWATPRITRILVSSNSQAVKNTQIIGLNIRELDLYSDGANNNIDNIIIRMCQIRNTTTAGQQGVLIRNNGASYVYFVKFYDCKFNDYADQSALAQGAVFVEGTNDGNGQLTFVNCEYKARTNNAVFMAVEGRIIQTVIDNLNCVNLAATGLIFFHLLPDGRMTDMRVMRSLFELHVAQEIFQLDDSTAATAMFHCDFSHNTFSLTNAQTIDFCDNDADDGDWTTIDCGLCAFNNYVKLNIASFSDANVNAAANFHYNVTGFDWTV